MKFLAVVLALFWGLFGMSTTVQAAGDPAQGPGGPILVVTSSSSTFGKYYAEILRTEGLNAFAVADISAVTAATLAAYDVVVLAKMPLAPAAVTMLTDWVNAGGNLIAMAPDPQLATLLGLATTGTSLSNGYLLVDTSTGPGNGIVNQTIQFHDTADRYTLNGATQLATLYSTASAATTNPAVTLRGAGSGRAAAFAYDLAASIVYTRQGNPAWSAQERDGLTPIRPNDKFFGNATGDVQADWIDLRKLAIPQADEQQRLLSNLILYMNQSKKPLPRFWYFPNGKKAVVIMTGDDHGNGGTAGRFDQFKTLSATGCSVTNWECVRGTSFVYTNTPLSDVQAGQYASDGFEVGLHINPGCLNFDLASLQAIYTSQVADFRAKYLSLGAPRTQRHHCLTWSDWSSAAEVQLSNGMRLDTTYSFYPPSWVNDTPGLFTGSAMPMRFARLDGSFVDVFMAATQMSDDAGQTYPLTVDTLLDRALGAEGYYGAYTVNATTDAAASSVADAVVTSALARGVPVVSAQQMLTWLDSRNSSFFGAMSFNAGALNFTITKDPLASGLQAMLPTRSGARLLSGITRSGSAVAFTKSTIKGVEYAFFAADGGSYAAAYATVAGAALASEVTAAVQVCPCGGWDSTATPGSPSVADPGPVELGVKFTTDVSGVVTGLRFYKGAGNTGTHVGNLWSSGGALLATATFTGETASGWQQVAFANPVAITANTVYVVSYFAPNGNYAADSFFFTNSGVDNAPVHLLKNGVSGGNGVYAYGSASTFPNSTFKETNYWVDVVFNTTGAADTTPPTVSATAPAAGATGVVPGTLVSATFSEAIDAATVSSSTFELRTPANALVAGTVSYNAGTLTATFTPTSPLSALTTYTATLKGGATDPRVKDLAGNALAANLTWSFTTAAGAVVPTCPCGGWDSTATPANASVADPGPVELGVKFTTDVSGVVTGLRFYKGAGNTGTHVGNLWSSGGALLATATFTGETASGWQQVAFANPVAITANTVYVVSYFAPNGNYAGDSFFFTNSGIDRAPVHILKDGVSGGNGVYGYGSVSTFPNSSFKATNYWVDVVFNTTGAADTTPPTVSATAPAGGATGVVPGTVVTATFSEAIDAATVSSSTFELRTPANALVAGTVSYNVGTLTATFTPTSPLSALTTYTATLKGGATDPRVKDLAGNALAANLSWSFTTETLGGACASPPNAIAAENCLPGNPSSEWDVSGAGDTSIQGFATQMSVMRGTTVLFKVDTAAANYRIDIYRLGYYAGLGARKVATVSPTVTLPQSQPNCLSDATTGLVDCGNWAISASWAVPSNAVSGIYIARLVRADNSGASHMVFVVRDDAGNSDLLFKTSDSTWQAYNDYGGNSLYVGSPAGRAYKVSYNRPFNTRGNQFSRAWLFDAEYPMVRWIEANGYNVSYIATNDVARSGSLLLNHKAFLSVGHDEYWSALERTNVEAARNAGVHLAFFSGNEMFWKTRWENSIDGSATAYRTLVTYKETHANAKIDPDASWTGTWRDPRFSPPADGGRPENALTGTIFTVNCCESPNSSGSIVVPAAEGKLRLWRNTSVATLGTGQSATLANGVLAYEWDEDVDNGFRPPGLVRLSSTTRSGLSKLQDYGSTYATGDATHNLTLYRHTSGALVFGAGTIRWPWGLDVNHDLDGSTPAGSATPDARMRQATVNLFADMNVQPGTLQSGLVPASASGDTVAPTSIIASPAAGAQVSSGNVVTVSGTAVDTGGGVVGGVEVSVDGGVKWHPATGRETWTYSWTPSATGSVVIKTRAADDSGRLEAPGSGIAVTVVAGGQACPCTIWSSSSAPTNSSAADNGAVNVGVKFRSDQDGSITGLRFYKGTANTGTHVGTLWSGAGTQLATATFTAETASGWQQVNFATPVAITANTIYVASYFAPNGGYAGDNNYFAAGGVDRAPLHALQNGVSGGNGVYDYGAGTVFPASTFQSSNYWVDVVFTPTVAPVDTTPPTVVAIAPASGATEVARASAVTANFSEAMDSATISTSSFELRDAANALVAATVGYNTSTQTVTLTPNAILGASTTYTATVRGGATDPRAKDLAGNALAANRSWSFTTVAIADTTAPTVTGISPASGATGVATNAAAAATFSEALDATTVSSSTLEVRDAANALVPSTVSYNATTFVATLTPNTALAAATTYTVTVKGGATDPRVKDVAGNALTANRTWSFTTSAVADTTPPTVTAINPASAATGVSRTTVVTATFSEAMDPATISASSVELRDPANALIASAVTYNSSTFVATLTPAAALAGSTAYTVTVKGGATDPRAKDLAGNALAVSRVWTFTTVALADTTPPTVTGVAPASGATGVSRTTAATATFSEAMDAATISSSTIELRDAANVLVASVVSYNATTQVVTLTPGATLAASTTYTVTVKGGATDPRVKDVAGNALAVSRTWSFTTAAPSGTNLAQGRVATQSSTGFSAPASRAVDGVTDGVFNNGSVSHTNSENQPWWQVDLSQTIAIDTIQIWNRTDCCADRLVNFYVFVAASDMTGRTLAQLSADSAVRKWQVASLGAAASISITASGQGRYVRVQLAGQNYLHLAEVKVFGVDATAPTVTAIAPASAATGVSRTAAVTATFSEAMDASTISSSTVELRNSANTLVLGTVTYNASTQVASLVPSAALAGSTTYTVTVKGGATDPRVKDIAGNALAANRTWSFTTVAADTTPPTITAISPSSGATFVSRTANVTATFSEAMDAATISTSTVELRSSGGTLVSAVVTYDAANRIMTLNPNPTLSSLTTYTVTIRGGATDPRVKDAAGNALTNNGTWSFKTGFF